MYYHVRITQKSNKSHDETRTNLTEEQLKERFLVPYEQCEPIIINGKTVPMEDLERIRISRSDKETKYIIPQLKAEDANSPVLVIGGPSYEWQAADRAEDVTDKLIGGAPGYKRRTTTGSKRETGIPMPGDQSSPKAFIVHGHDEAAKESVARLCEKLGLRAIILHEQPNAGRTIIEKFESNSNVDFALVLLTPDDVGARIDKKDELKPRARQNVILELGYFMGKLGRGRVCVLHKEGVEIPSDYEGVLYIPMDLAGAWRMKLAQEIQVAGLPVDLNSL